MPNNGKRSTEEEKKVKGEGTDIKRARDSLSGTLKEKVTVEMLAEALDKSVDAYQSYEGSRAKLPKHLEIRLAGFYQHSGEVGDTLLEALGLASSLDLTGQLSYLAYLNFDKHQTRDAADAEIREELKSIVMLYDKGEVRAALRDITNLLESVKRSKRPLRSQAAVATVYARVISELGDHFSGLSELEEANARTADIQHGFERCYMEVARLSYRSRAYGLNPEATVDSFRRAEQMVQAFSKSNRPARNPAYKAAWNIVQRVRVVLATDVYDKRFLDFIDSIERDFEESAGETQELPDYRLANGQTAARISALRGDLDKAMTQIMACSQPSDSFTDQAFNARTKILSLLVAKYYREAEDLAVEWRDKCLSCRMNKKASQFIGLSKQARLCSSGKVQYLFPHE